jgi:hypothetical protein
MTFGTNKISTKSKAGSVGGKADACGASSAQVESARATAERRMRTGGSQLSATAAAAQYNERGETYQCHVCSSKFADPVLLLTHMESTHGGVASNPAPMTAAINRDHFTAAPPAPPAAAAVSQARSASNSNSSGGSGPEVCPQCDHRFQTVDQLIAHFETAHDASSGGNGRSKNNNNSNRSNASSNGDDKCGIS